MGRVFEDARVVKAHGSPIYHPRISDRGVTQFGDTVHVPFGQLEGGFHARAPSYRVSFRQATRTGTGAQCAASWVTCHECCTALPSWIASVFQGLPPSPPESGAYGPSILCM